MFRQFVLFVKTNNVNVKAKEFLLLLDALAMIRYNALLYILRFCR